MHNHQAEVIRERVRDEIPLAREVLEPDLWLGSLVVAVDESQSAIFDLAIDIESPHVFASQRLPK